MITDTFDNKSEAKINPKLKEDAPEVDACVITFSNVIEEYVLKNFECKQIAQAKCVTGIIPIYQIDYKGKKIAFYKSFIGGPAYVGILEDVTCEIKTDKYILFGGSGCLNKEIARGKIIVPTDAYRDEGTSYHYKEPSDYIKIKNSDIVAKFMEENDLPYVLGKTWTTDAFFRETINNIEKRKADGCISVEMESASVQAMCDFRNLDLYVFFTSGDLLDAPKWDTRRKEGQIKGTQHDPLHFDIALELACFVSNN